MEIEDQVRGGEKFGKASKAIQDAEIRKRWLFELKHGPAKTESKAINRALRAGLAIPTSVKQADLAKPFLVVGFNFTPNYDDPSVKRALVAVAMNAQAAIYGGRDVSEDMPETAGADIPAAAIESGADADEGPIPVDDVGGQADADVSDEGGEPDDPRPPPSRTNQTSPAANRIPNPNRKQTRRSRDAEVSGFQRPRSSPPAAWSPRRVGSRSRRSSTLPRPATPAVSNGSRGRVRTSTRIKRFSRRSRCTPARVTLSSGRTSDGRRPGRARRRARTPSRMARRRSNSGDRRRRGTVATRADLRDDSPSRTRSTRSSDSSRTVP